MKNIILSIVFILCTQITWSQTIADVVSNSYFMYCEYKTGEPMNFQGTNFYILLLENKTAHFFRGSTLIKAVEIGAFDVGAWYANQQLLSVSSSQQTVKIYYPIEGRKDFKSSDGVLLKHIINF